MATKVGGLFVSMAASAARITKDFREARKAAKASANGMSNDFKKASRHTGIFSGNLGKLKGAAIAAAGPAGLVLLIKRSIQTADTIAKVADKVGVSTDALQEYRFAASLAGVEQKTLDMALQRFSRRVGEAQNGTGELTGTLKEYNIAVRDSEGRTRATDDVLNDLANTIQNAESDQERLRIAFKAFDSEGAALVNMLKDGSKGLEEYRAEARRLGVVINEDLIRNAEHASNQLEIMSRVISSNLTSSVIAFAPQITDLADSFTESLPTIIAWVNKFLEFTGAVKPDALKVANEELGEMNTEIERLEKNKAGETKFMKWLTGGFEFNGNEEALAALIVKRDELMDQIAEMEAQQTADAEAAKKRAADEIAAQEKVFQANQKRLKQLADEKKAEQEKAAEAKRAADEKKKALDEFNTAFEAMTTDQFQLERDALTASVEAWRKAGADKTEIERLEAERRKQIARDEFAFKLGKADELLNALAALADGVTAMESAQIDKRLAAEEQAETDSFNAHVAKIEDRYTVDGEITEAGLEKLADLQTVHDGKLSELRDKADRDKKKSAKKMKPIKVAQAISNTAVAVTEAYPNIPLAVLVGLLGAAQVATISAQPYAKGGVVNSPTMFGHSGGLGIMGEVPGQAEAIMPLQRTPTGELGVNASGVGSKETTFIQENHFHGIAPEKFINDTVAPILEDGARKGMNKIVTNEKLHRVVRAII